MKPFGIQCLLLSLSLPQVSLVLSPDFGEMATHCMHPLEQTKRKTFFPLFPRIKGWPEKFTVEFSLLEHSSAWISWNSFKTKTKQESQPKASRRDLLCNQEQLFSGSRKKGKIIQRQLSSWDTIQRFGPKMRLFWQLTLWLFTLQSNFFILFVEKKLLFVTLIACFYLLD